MYSIQFSDWGLVLEFVGLISEDLIQDWLSDLQQLTGGLREDFGVVVDLREAQPGSPRVSAGILSGLRTLERAGLVRAVVIVNEEYDTPWGVPPDLPALPQMRRVEARSGARWLACAHGWVQRDTPPDLKSNSDATPAP